MHEGAVTCTREPVPAGRYTVLPMKLIACTAALSEGRRRDVLDAFVARIESVEGVRSLELLADPDQNRSTMTFAAPRAKMEEAAFVLASHAAEVIDLTCHQGEHPRIGALDELAFFPVGRTPLEDCVRVARECGERIGEQLELPVYFAEEAATRPELKRAASLRRLQFEGLRELASRSDSESSPESTGLFEADAGPRTGPHARAGALVVLARAPWCHFDVLLESTDAALGRRIADEVRDFEITATGTRSVSACVFARDDEQSIEIVTRIVDPVRVGLESVFHTIENRAREAGVKVLSCSLSGLVPARAVDQDLQRELPLEEFDPDAQILETRLAATG